MSYTDTKGENRINVGTYQAIQDNISNIPEDEIIITEDKVIPTPFASDSGKVVGVDSNGEFELKTLPDFTTFATKQEANNLLSPTLVGTNVTYESSQDFGQTDMFAYVGCKFNIGTDNQGIYILTFGNCFSILMLYGYQKNTRYAITGTYVYNIDGSIVTRAIKYYVDNSNNLYIYSPHTDRLFVKNFTAYLFKLKLY